MKNPIVRAFQWAMSFWGASSSYEGANQSKRRSSILGAAPRDYHLDLTPSVRAELVRKSRYVSKNSGFVKELVEGMDLYSVGDGILPQALSSDKSWNIEAEKYFARWAKRADSSGRFSLAECQSLVCKSIDIDGEIFIHKVIINGTPSLQLIETHRVGGGESDEMVKDGIKMGPWGNPISYLIKEDNGEIREIKAENMIHIFTAESPSQVRGLPTLQHSTNNVIDVMELLALEKHAVKSNADIAYVLSKRQEIDDEEDNNFFSNGATDEKRTNPNKLQNIIGGKVVQLETGEDIKPYESQRPSQVFTGFLEHLNRDSSLGGIPYEFAADSSKIGGAGVRLVVAKAGRKFSRRQTLIISRMMEHLWKFVIGNAILTGKLKAPEDWIDVTFTTPKSVTVDAGREAQQNREDVKAGLKTLTEHYAELGMDFHSEMAIRAEEINFIKTIAEQYKINPALLYAGFKEEKQTTL